DQEEVKKYIADKGRQYYIDNVVTRCPTKAVTLRDDDTLEINNRDCVRCMHCLNVMPKALHPGDDKGVTICMGGKRTLKIGDLMGTVIIPFKKLETEDARAKLLLNFKENERDGYRKAQHSDARPARTRAMAQLHIWHQASTR
ncbi:hypothetical protein TI04_13930, partial [Achromatium sp. WMS2]